MEISREKLSAKLDTIPEGDREAYVAALKAKGYTWGVGPVKDAVAQPSGNTPPPNESFEVAGRYNTPGGTPSYAPPSTVDDGSQFSATRALLTNDPTKGLAEDFVRGAPAAIGGMVGAAGGVGVGSIPFAGLGAAGGEGVRQNFAQLYALANGKELSTPRQVATNMAAQGVTNAAGQGVSLAAGPALRFAGNKAADFAEYTAKNIAGVSKQSYDFAKNNIASVAKYIGADPEKANALAVQLRGSIDDAAKAGEDYYRTVVDKIVGDGTNVSGVKINARKSLAESVDSIRKQFGYDAPMKAAHAGHGAPAVKPLEILDEFGQVASRLKPEEAAVRGTVRVTSPDEAAAFGKFAEAIGKMKEASPQQVYFLQKDLNGAIENAYGTPLGAALKQLRTGVRKMVNDNARDLPDLVDANKAYAAAQDLRETAKKLVNSNDLVGEIRRTFSNEFATGKKAAIDEIAARVPSVGKTVNELRSFNAGASFTPAMRALPQTGMGASIAHGFVYEPLRNGLAAGALAGPLTGMAVGAGTAAKNVLASPRAQFAALKYGTAAASGMSRAAGAVAPYASKAVAPTAGFAGSRVGELLGATQPQLSPNMQAVLEAANRR